MKTKPCPACGNPPEITIGAEGKTASFANKQCWLHGVYVPIRQWNKRPTSREFSKAEWEKLAEALHEKARSMTPGTMSPPFDKLQDSSKAKYVEIAKFIARKLK